MFPLAKTFPAAGAIPPGEANASEHARANPAGHANPLFNFDVVFLVHLEIAHVYFVRLTHWNSPSGGETGHSIPLVTVASATVENANFYTIPDFLRLATFPSRQVRSGRPLPLCKSAGEMCTLPTISGTETKIGHFHVQRVDRATHIRTKRRHPFGNNMTLRYLGSKARVGEELKSHIGRPRGGRFVDAFCGTGAVAEIAADLGWPVAVNDHLTAAVSMSVGRLASRQLVRFSKLGGYGEAIDALNRLRGRRGFIWREYSPASLQASTSGIERRYFSEANAAKIDAVRTRIADWRDDRLLTIPEERVLVADLLAAANRVANIAGTYGCFLSKWTAQSRGVLTLRPRDLRSSRTAVEASIGDVHSVSIRERDTAYLDPPYTKRQYASYYHILETITLGDSPEVEGVSGLRPWRNLASDFCYKSRALDALVRLISAIPAHRILLSYSNEGHVQLNDLRDALKSQGQVSVVPLKEVGRYRPNKKAAVSSLVGEFLMVIQRTTRVPRTRALAPA